MDAWGRVVNSYWLAALVWAELIRCVRVNGCDGSGGGGVDGKVEV